MLVADGDRQSRSQLAELLRRLGCDVREAATGDDVLAAAREALPALVVLEVALEKTSGYEVCRELREIYGETVMIMFVSSAPVRSSDEVACLLIGADEVLSKPVDPDRFLARARRLLSRSGARSSMRDDAAGLTPREHEVLSQLVYGKRTGEIAADMHIAPKTVSTHVEHIMRKLDTHSQAQTVALAVREGLVEVRRRAG